eukprot:Tbor_TRINITY_DN3349_c0_g1::TRINITY_DN3349_c0_g1_i1::g.23403::m.23403
MQLHHSAVFSANCTIRRVLPVTCLHPSSICNTFPFPSSTSIAATPVTGQWRFDTTGSHHSYEPGPITKAIRKVVVLLTPTGIRESIALRLQGNMETVERLEKEQAWIRKHGSPLRVMGLPDHAEYAEVKERYRDLLFETHPDTAPSTPSATSITNDGELASSSNGSSSTPVDSDASVSTSISAVNVSTTQQSRSSRSTDEPDHLILQVAYQMVTNPDSLFHRNNSAPALLQDLYSLGKYKGTSRITQITFFAAFCYLVGAIGACIMVFVVIRQLWEVLFRLFDSKTFEYIEQREKEEMELRAAGIEVNSDPLQFAPEAVNKVLFPGRYVN